MSAKRTLLSILLAVLFAATLLFAFDYVTVNAGHECTGERCSICAVLHTAEEISGGAQKSEPTTPSPALPVAACRVLHCGEDAEQPGDTPVSLCDVLLD